MEDLAIHLHLAYITNVLPFLPSTLSGLVEFDGFFLESDPCLVCNNPEVPLSVSLLLTSTICLYHLCHTPIIALKCKASLNTTASVWLCWAFPLILFWVCPQNIKLSSIKVDTRYTTTQQVVKLIGSHTISKVTVKIGDLKRTKMVRTVNLYYNNRTVQAIVELKNKWVVS